MAALPTKILRSVLERVEILPHVHMQGRSRSLDFGLWHISMNYHHIGFNDILLFASVLFRLIEKYENPNILISCYSDIHLRDLPGVRR